MMNDNGKGSRNEQPPQDILPMGNEPSSATLHLMPCLQPFTKNLSSLQQSFLHFQPPTDSFEVRREENMQGSPKQTLSRQVASL